MKLNLSPMRRTLAVAVLAVASAAALPALAQPMGGMPFGPGMHRGPGGGGPGMHLSERMLDAVKATPEQRTQIRQIMDGARKDMFAQREARLALRDEAMRVLTQPNVDANAVEALRQKQMAQHEQASRRMTQAMLDASRVLTPEQRKQLADNMQKRRDMMQRHWQERRALDAPKT